MVTFILCLALLVVAYFTYGKYLDKVCKIDAKAEVPSAKLYDGVDYVPMPRWRTFLIQLLNIAKILGYHQNIHHLLLILQIFFLPIFEHLAHIRSERLCPV